MSVDLLLLRSNFHDDGGVHFSMSSYEQTAWDNSLRRLHEPPGAGLLPHRAKDAIGSGKEAVARFADSHLPTETVKAVVEKVMDGALELTFTPALRTANADRALKAYRRRHDGVQSLDDLKQLDVRELDKFRRRKGVYVATSAVQASATSVVVTGSVVSSTVSAGAASGTVVAAVAGDTVASLAVMGRSVGSVAVRYGYDVRLPDEELFAMGVLTLGTAGSLEAKQAALAALSRLTQQMMRRATWEQLNRQVLVRTIGRVYQALGLKLTQRKLAQTVPVVGIGINAALSASMTRHVYQRAEDVYRIRFLSEKYGLDATEWLRMNGDGGYPESESADSVDIAEVLQQEIESSEQIDPG